MDRSPANAQSVETAVPSPPSLRLLHRYCLRPVTGNTALEPSPKLTPSRLTVVPSWPSRVSPKSLPNDDVMVMSSDTLYSSVITAFDAESETLTVEKSLRRIASNEAVRSPSIPITRSPASNRWLFEDGSSELPTYRTTPSNDSASAVYPVVAHTPWRVTRVSVACTSLVRVTIAAA